MASPRKPRHYRDVEGILILDKPIGISSSGALQQVRGLYQARKAGHCGSLDPLATGVLPICMGEATKFSDYLLGADKTYTATCQLGQTTTTGDAEGEVIETSAVAVDESQVRSVLEGFIGEIEQVPPMYSALKHQGKRLYQLAREGQQVERKPRRVKIYQLTLLSLSGERLVLEVSCSKGTYIRTLAEDIGAELGCGAHISALHRSAVGSFEDRDALSLEQLQMLEQQALDSLDKLLLPISTALAQFPELNLNPAGSLDICHGKRVQLLGSKVPGLHRLVSSEGRFLGLGEVFPGGELAPKRLMNTGG